MCKSLDLQSDCLHFQSMTEEMPRNLLTQPHDIQYYGNRLKEISVQLKKKKDYKKRWTPALLIANLFCFNYQSRQID